MSVFKKIVYSISGNSVSLIVSSAMILIVPKVMSLEDYGLWQLYLFYFSYAGLLHFGWVDGIYLRYAGRSYDSLDKKDLASQFYGILLLQIIIGLFIAVYTFWTTFPLENKIILYFISISLVLVNINGFSNFILQMTSRIKEYAFIATLDAISFVSVASFMMICGNIYYYNLIFAKLISLIIVSLYSLYQIKDIILSKKEKISIFFKEAKINLSVGSKLLAANIAGLLIVGVIRFGISQEWDIETFGKISLALSLSNFLLIFINAISVVLLPILRQLPSNDRLVVFNNTRTVLDVMLPFALLLYYPIKLVLSIWIPRYEDALVIMAILFPISLFQCRLSLLINTYLKALRMEKLILRINIISVIISVLFSVLTIMVFHNLNLCILSIVWIFAFQCFFSEYKLALSIGTDVSRQIISLSVLTIVFIYSSWIYGGVLGGSIYFIAYIIYLAINKSAIITVLSTWRSQSNSIYPGKWRL